MSLFLQQTRGVCKIFDLSKIPENVRLFDGIEGSELADLLDCMGARVVSYAREQFVFLAGDPVSGMGIVCSGSVQVVREDVFGNRAILAKLQEGDLFGEVFACAGVERLPVSVVAMEAAQILLVDFRKIVSTCSSNCPFHGRLIENMLGILADKNLMLNRKIEALSARSTRGKLLAFLDAQARTAGSRHFRIPFNRQELADYLSVDRSAMSAELGKMRDEGLLRFRRDEFQLLKPEGTSGEAPFFPSFDSSA